MAQNARYGFVAEGVDEDEGIANEAGECEGGEVYGRVGTIVPVRCSTVASLWEENQYCFFHIYAGIKVVLYFRLGDILGPIDAYGHMQQHGSPPQLFEALFSAMRMQVRESRADIESKDSLGSPLRERGMLSREREGKIL